MAKGTRRAFITRTMLGFGGYLAVASGACRRASTDAEPPKKAPTPHAPGLPPEGLKALNPEQFQLIAAVCERILPRDEDPGATDLGCAAYIDRVLADPELGAMWGRQVIGGIAALDRQSRGRFQKPFVDATIEQQETLLSAWQQSLHSGETAFFVVMHSLTLEGAFGDPTYGGNKAGNGYALVGFRPPPPTPGMQMIHLGH